MMATNTPIIAAAVSGIQYLYNILVDELTIDHALNLKTCFMFGLQKLHETEGCNFQQMSNQPWLHVYSFLKALSLSVDSSAMHSKQLHEIRYLKQIEFLSYELRQEELRRRNKIYQEDIALMSDLHEKNRLNFSTILKHKVRWSIGLALHWQFELKINTDNWAITYLMPCGPAMSDEQNFLVNETNKLLTNRLPNIQLATSYITVIGGISVFEEKSDYACLNNDLLLCEKHLIKIFGLLENLQANKSTITTNRQKYFKKWRKNFNHTLDKFFLINAINYIRPRRLEKEEYYSDIIKLYDLRQQHMDSTWSEIVKLFEDQNDKLKPRAISKKGSSRSTSCDDQKQNTAQKRYETAENLIRNGLPGLPSEFPKTPLTLHKIA